MTKDAEDRLSLRIDRMEDMQRFASERTNALVNEISALNTNCSVTSVTVTRILKIIDGNGEQSLEKRLLSQQQQIKAVTDTQDAVKGWKKLMIASALSALMVLVVGFIWSKLTSPANQAAAVKSQGEAAVKSQGEAATKTQGEIKAADSRIDGLESNQKLILERLDAALKTQRPAARVAPSQPRRRSRPEPTLNWNRELIVERQPSIPTMAYNHSPLKELP